MKKLAILSAIAVGSLFISKANAQVSIQFGIHIPAHRVYVPAPPPPVVEEQPVYDDNDNVNVSDDDDYYYLPEVEAYYNVGAGCYYYNDGSRWVSCAYLPGAYRDYNWRTAVRYEVRAPRPFMHHDFYRSRWGGYAGDRNNWGHRFDRRPVNGYAYRQGWGGDRGNWGRRPNPYDNRGSGNWGGGRDNHNWGNGQQPNNGNHDNHGGWGNGNQPNNGNHDNHGNWGNGQPNNGNHDNHGGGNGQPNNGNHDNHGNWGNGHPSNGGGHDRGSGGERFTQNGNSGRGMRRF